MGGQTLVTVAAATVIVLKWFHVTVPQEELIVVLSALAAIVGAIVTMFGRFRRGDLYLFNKPDQDV